MFEKASDGRLYVRLGIHVYKLSPVHCVTGAEVPVIFGVDIERSGPEMSSVSSYQNKRVIVTGSSSGIGQATARALARAGATVIGVDRKASGIPLASFESLDLSDPASVRASVSRIGGTVDALFNCAGVNPMRPAAEVLKVNFLGTRLFTEQVADLMPPGSAIVNTSSNGGYAWRKRLPLLLEFLRLEDFGAAIAWHESHQDAVGQAYSFGKEALNVWTMQQSAVLINRGIRINTASPGAVQTPMLDAIEDALSAAAIAPTERPIGRRSAPEEQASVLLFLNSDDASYVNGADLAVDGGYWAARSVAGSLWG